ncbi:MAG: VWA domain-containing protein [Gemmatimonadetes bacterium]|nr:VWA domain-containing protein [Gemmatimonadota bacterium]
MTVGFTNPWALLLLALVPLWAAWLRRGRPGAVAFARTDAVAHASRGRGRWAGAAPDVLRGLSFALLVVALAGPRTGARVVEEASEGIAIMVAVDVSQSMLAEDLRPRNRLGAARQTVARFIQGRANDRIGLVAFAGEAMTRVPLTRDHAVLADAVDGLRSGGLGEGTAIGDGLAAAAARLRRAEERSKVVVLMSDGANNRGEVDPRQAARAAALLGIRVYTIAMGSDTVARIPVALTRVGVRYAIARTTVDEALLADIASTSGGRYFRARDTEALRRIYEEIDRLERTPVTARRYLRYRDWYLPFLLTGAVVLILEWLFRATRWGRVP